MVTGGNQVVLPASAANLTATAGLGATGATINNKNLMPYGVTGPVQAAGAIPATETNPADGQTIITQ